MWVGRSAVKETPWSWTVAARSQSGLEGGHQVLIRWLLWGNGPRISCYRGCTGRPQALADCSAMPLQHIKIKWQSGWLKGNNKREIKANCYLKLHQIGFCPPEQLGRDVGTKLRKLGSSSSHITSMLNIIWCCHCSRYVGHRSHFPEVLFPAKIQGKFTRRLVPQFKACLGGSVVGTLHSIDRANLNLCSFGKHVRKTKRVKKTPQTC